MSVRTMHLNHCTQYRAPQRVYSALQSWRLSSQASSASCLSHWRSDTRSPANARYFVSAAAKHSDPLRILFCGSDEFSCASFRALLAEQRENPRFIRSIDVVVKPAQRTGRGFKQITRPRLHDLADTLSIRVHERETFTGWDMPRGINLIIAVSFGLFVPPRLLQQAKYGGLNVHPSLLPDLRGPAPLQHTILQARQYAGVSLQTLDAERFDHGIILSQTGPEEIPVPQDCTFQMLHDILAPKGAELLRNGLRERLYVPPLRDISHHATSAPSFPSAIQHAPKITKEDQQITRANVHDIVRIQNAIGPVWFFCHARQRNNPLSRKRVIVNQLDADMSPAYPPELGFQKGPRLVPRGDKSQSTWERYFDPMTLTLIAKKPRLLSEASDPTAPTMSSTPTESGGSSSSPTTTTTTTTPAESELESEPEPEPELEKGWEHIHLKAWVRKLPIDSSSGGILRAHGLALRDLEYVYLPDQGCRLRAVTVAGDSQKTARQALTKWKYLTEGHDLFK